MPEADCQCSLWTTRPDFLASQGIPRGYCGLCEVCGRPGHTRHFPGTSPCTGSWCEPHYRRLAWLHPLGVYGRRVWTVALVGLVVVYLAWPR